MTAIEVIIEADRIDAMPTDNHRGWREYVPTGTVTTTILYPGGGVDVMPRRPNSDEVAWLMFVGWVTHRPDPHEGR